MQTQDDGMLEYLDQIGRANSSAIAHFADMVAPRADLVREPHLDGSYWDGSFESANVASLDASNLRLVPGGTEFPVDQAVRVSTCQALFDGLPGSLLAKFSDEIPPSRRVRHHGDLVVCQPIQLSIRLWDFAIIAWVEPSRLRAYRPLFFHALPSSFHMRDVRRVKPVLSVALNCRQACRAAMVQWLRQAVNQWPV